MDVENRHNLPNERTSLPKLGCDSEAGQSGGFSHACWMSYLAGHRDHNLPGERRTAGARPADGGTRVPANNQTLRPDKGRDYTEQGGANPAVTLFEDLLQYRAITVTIKAHLYPKRPDTFPDLILAQCHLRCET
jgi:hypothetical protein